MKNNRSGQAAILSDRDYARIRKFLPKRQRIFFDILWYTGERAGAVCQLRVADVYRGTIPHDVITFRAATRKGKTDTRQTPVHPNLAESLRAFKVAADSVWLFPCRLDGSKPITFQGIAWGLNKAIAKAGLLGKGISSHSFRRSFITHLHEKGVDIRTIQEITGHRDLDALQRYVNISASRVRCAIELL